MRFGAVARAHIDARRASPALNSEIIRSKGINHRLLDQPHQFAHAKLAAAQVHEQINHYLAGPVIRDLAATVDFDEGDAAIGDKQVSRVAGEPQRINGGCWTIQS